MNLYTFPLISFPFKVLWFVLFCYILFKFLRKPAEDKQKLYSTHRNDSYANAIEADPVVEHFQVEASTVVEHF